MTKIIHMDRSHKARKQIGLIAEDKIYFIDIGKTKQRGSIFFFHIFYNPKKKKQQKKD